MNSFNQTRRRACVLTVVALLALPTLGWAQQQGRQPPPQGEKSAEDILQQLLTGERGVGGVRVERRDPSEPPRVAVPIHFKYNSAEITAQSFAQLQRIAQALDDPRLHGAPIRVEGYTDNQGTEAYNLALSQRRAEAVKQFLVQQGHVSPARLIAKGYGKTRPLPDVPQDTEEGRAANRRVEFVNLGASAAEATTERPGPGGSAPPSVQVSVTYERDGQTRTLAAGDVLTPKDNYRVSFTPQENAYVYVFQLDAAGKASPVFPNSEYSAVQNPVEGKQRYAVPPEGKWLMLDQHPGDEEIVVLASRTELADAKGMAQRMRTTALAAPLRGPAPNTRPDVAPEMPAGVFSYRVPFAHR